MSAGKLMALVITETMKLIGDRRRPAACGAYQ
jgi:hypothetical protein